VLLRKLMAFALTIGYERLFAAWEPADEVLLSLVDSLMNAQVSTLREGFPTDLALVRLLLGVRSHVGLQCVVSRELCITLGTWERLFFSVDSDVVLQMSFSGEALVTPLEVARERLEALVRVHVILESVLLEELLAAIRALVFRLFMTLKGS